MLGLKKKCGEEGAGLLRGCREGFVSRDEGLRGRREEARGCSGFARKGCREMRESDEGLEREARG